MNKKAKKTGSRHRLLFYRRTMDRVWQRTIWLFLILGAIWWWPNRILILTPNQDTLVLVGAGVTGFVTVFAFLTKNAGYVQPRYDHLRISTPFIRLAVSYRRFRGVRSVSVVDTFPTSQLTWADERFLEPYGNESLVSVIVSDYPMPLWVLKLFFPKHMFSTQQKAFLILVDDWMKFSTELDSRYGTWRQSRRSGPKRKGFAYGKYK